MKVSLPSQGLPNLLRYVFESGLTAVGTPEAALFGIVAGFYPQTQNWAKFDFQAG